MTLSSEPQQLLPAPKRDPVYAANSLLPPLDLKSLIPAAPPLTIEDIKGQVPPFIANTWRIIEDTATNGTVNWNSKGDAILVFSKETMATQVLPNYFKTRSFESYVRQLNFYGFRKRANEEGSASCFAHPLFLRGRLDLLKTIKKRKSVKKLPASATSRIAALEAEMTRARLRMVRYEALLTKQAQMMRSLTAALNLKMQEKQQHQNLPQKPICGVKTTPPAAFAPFGLKAGGPAPPQLDELSLASFSGSEESVATGSRKRNRSATPKAEPWSGGSSPASSSSVTLEFDKNSPLWSERADPHQGPALKKLRLLGSAPPKPKLQRAGSISGFFQVEDAKTAVNLVGLPELSEPRESDEAAASPALRLFDDFATSFASNNPISL